MRSILFVHHVSVIGGASYCLLNILKEVDRSKYTPIVLLKDKGPLVDEISRLGISVYYLPSLCTVPYNVTFVKPSTIQSYRKVCKSKIAFFQILQQIKPDILYLNNSMLYPYLRIAKEAGIKTLIHIREHWPLDEHVIQLSWFQKNISKYADHIIAINEYSAQMVPNVEPKTTIIYDWIDFTDRYVKYDMNKLLGEDVSDKKLFLYTGGMQYIKGAIEVLEGFSRTAHSDYRLIALGCNPELNLRGWRGFLKKLLLRLGYQIKSIRLANAIINDNRIKCIPSTYAIKDIIQQSYCVLSYFTMPHANLALAESIILKTPVLAAHTAESDEYSYKGKYAELFEFKNKNQFESKLSDIDLWRPNLINRLEEGSLKLADKFDRNRNAIKFRNILDNI